MIKIYYAPEHWFAFVDVESQHNFGPLACTMSPSFYLWEQQRFFVKWRATDKVSEDNTFIFLCHPFFHSVLFETIISFNRFWGHLGFIYFTTNPVFFGAAATSCRLTIDVFVPARPQGYDSWSMKVVYQMIGELWRCDAIMSQGKFCTRGEFYAVVVYYCNMPDNSYGSHR